MSRAALQSFTRTVTVQWPKHQADGGKALLIKTAKAGHEKIVADAVARSGAHPTAIAYANTPGRPIEAVILPGPIVYKYAHIREVCIAALNALRLASPVQSGNYRDSHTLFVINGKRVAGVPANIKPGDTVMIGNPVPYARKLEIGKTKSGRAFLIKVPNRIYERVAKLVLVPKYGKVASITFAYATLPEGYKLAKNNASRKWLGGARKGARWYVEPRQRKDRVKGAALQTPVIVIRNHT